MEAVANIEALYENAVLLHESKDQKHNDDNVTIRRFAAPFIIDGQIADALLTQKESFDKEHSARVYSLELEEIIKPSGKTSVADVISDYRHDGINKLQQKHDKIKQFLEKNGIFSAIPQHAQRNTANNEFY